jgi:hypothetical protein
VPAAYSIRVADHGGLASVAAVSLLVLSSWTLGRLTLLRLEWPEIAGYERAALRLTAGLGLTALVLAGLALANAWHLAILVIAALAAAGAVLAVRDAPRWRRSFTPPLSSAARVFAWALSLAAVLGVAGAVAPVTDDDALTYVVPIARHIAESGALRVWADQARSMWPLSQQMLLAFVLRAGGDRLGLVTAVEWALCLGVLSALARRVCTRREHVWAALVIGLGSPVVAFQVASAKEDLLLVAATAAAGFCLTGALALPEVAAAGLFAGLAAGAKYPGALIAAAVIGWVAIRSRRARARDALVAALCAAAAGGLWYGLNLWRYGNPVAPFLFGAAGTRLDAEAARNFMDSFGAGRGLWAFASAPVRVFLEPSLFCGRANLYNPLAYAGLAALASAGARRRHAPLLFLAGVFYTGWFLTLQNARLLLPAAVLIAPAAADRLMPLLERTRRLAPAIASAVAMASLGIVAAVGVVRAERFVRAPAAFLERETQNFADLQWMNVHLDPARDRVGSDHKVLAHLVIPSVLLDPVYQTEIGRGELADPVRLLAAFRRQGLTHLFGSAGSFGALRAHLRPVYRNRASRRGGVRFFREPPTEDTVVFEIVYP